MSHIGSDCWKQKKYWEVGTFKCSLFVAINWSCSPSGAFSISYSSPVLLKLTAQIWNKMLKFSLWLRKMTKFFCLHTFLMGHLIVLFLVRESIWFEFLPNVGFTILPISFFSVELFSYSLELDFTSVYTVSLNEDIFQYEVNELMPRHIITCKQWTYTVPSTSIKQRYLLFCWLFSA